MPPPDTSASTGADFAGDTLWKVRHFFYSNRALLSRWGTAHASGHLFLAERYAATRSRESMVYYISHANWEHSGWHGWWRPLTQPQEGLRIHFDYRGDLHMLIECGKHTVVWKGLSMFEHREQGYDFGGDDYAEREVWMQSCGSFQMPINDKRTDPVPYIPDALS